MKIYLLLLLVIMSQTTEVVDFKNKNEIKKWYVINDGVMGGVSSSRLNQNDNFAKFEGQISLDYNGGFASIIRPLSKLSVDKNSTIKLNLKGDNKYYQIRIKDLRRNYYSYVYTLFVSNEWETYDIKLNKFKPQFRGFKLNKPNFDEATIEELGILIGNKKNENFELNIKTISIIK